MTPMLWRLCWISFFADISSEFLYPILPIFLTVQLGASMGALGLIEGTSELVASILKARVGVWSDQVQRRKPFIAFGYTLSTISKAMIGLATAWSWVFAARVFDRVGKGVRTAPRDALIAESVPREKLGFAFGVHRLMDTLGAVLGPLAAVGLLSLGWTDLRLYFLFALIPGGVAVLITFWLKEAAKKNLEPSEVSIKPKPRFFELPHDYHRFLIAWGLFAICNSSDAFILLKMKASGLELIPTILIYCGFNLVYAVFSLVFGKWSDRVGQRAVILVSFLMFLFCYAGFAFASSLQEYIFYYAVYGLYMAMSEGVSKALVSRLVPQQYLATAQGYFGLVNGVCLFFASVIAGVLWQHFGAAAPFLYGAAGAFLAFLFMGFSLRRPGS